MPELKKDEIVHVTIDDLAYGGLGVGRVDQFVVFVENALPGERIAARLVKKKKNHAQAVIQEILEPSPYRVAAAPCDHYGPCGGCTWQNFDVEQQAHWKQKQVVDTLKHLGGQQDYELLPIIHSPKPWRYRNKMEFTFGYEDDGRLLLGFHRKGKFDHLLAIDNCLIQPEPFDAMLKILVDYGRAEKLAAYDPRTHAGFLRFAVMRHSATTGESILALLTTRGDLPNKEALAARLKTEVPGFKAMLWGLTESLADVARIEQEVWRSGDTDLIETVNGLTFAISPQSFFQTNTAGAELLYAKVADMADLGPEERLLDAYCGAGAIALHCARRAGRVVGVELVTAAIWDARENARRNHIDNATFIAAPMAQGLALARHAAGGPFTRVIIDPPRGGMDKRALRGLLDLNAPVFLYVSCNPATLARDIQTVVEAGYKVDQVQPVDMFPHTYHIETIVKLRRS